MGPYAESLNPYVVLAVFIIFAGTVLYKYESLTGAEAEEERLKPARFVKWVVRQEDDGYHPIN